MTSLKLLKIKNCIEKILFKDIFISSNTRFKVLLRNKNDDYIDINDDIPISNLDNTLFNEDNSIFKPRSISSEKRSKRKSKIKLKLEDLPELIYNNEYIEEDLSKNIFEKRETNNDAMQILKNKLKKKLLAKKSRIKLKYLSAIKLMQKLNKQILPRNFQNMIKQCKISWHVMDSVEQRDCFNFFSKLTKEELIIVLILSINSEAELTFVKEFLLSEKYVDMLFKDLDLDNIDNIWR